ncbi:MAG: hypothetical protein Fur0034_20020 [Desulfuromonadia bacterium]
MTSTQRCVVCAWRQTCAKKFSVPDGGARCPDFTRDVSLKERDGQKKEEDDRK